MASQWHSFEPSQLFPVPIQRAASAVTALVDTAARATAVTEKALRLASKIASKVSTNPVEDALRAALAEVNDFVAGLEFNTQAHAIIIPIRKKALRRTKGRPAIEDFVDPSEPVYAFLQNAKTARAGTGMFFRTLVDSLGDAGDLNRPQFPPNYATVGACVLAGAESLSDLQVPLRLFSTLFATNQRVAPDSGVLPVLQNLRVTTLAGMDGVQAALRWDPLPPVTNLPLFTGELLTAREIFLIQTTKPFTQGWSTWNDLFSAEPLDSPTDLQDKGDSRVVARIRNNGFVTAHVDTSRTLDPKKTYYYTACVRYALDGEIQPMGPLSNTVRVSRSAPQPSTRRATAPDWIATPAAVTLFPPLHTVLNQLRLTAAQMGSLTTSNTGGSQLLSQTIQQLQRLTQQWESLVQDTKEVTDRLQLLTSARAPGGIYATTITNGTGGIDRWMSDLARRLSDTEDPSAPNLSDQAMVVGFVIVGGAPRLPQLAPLVALLQAFFGRHDRSAVAEVLDTLGTGTGTTSVTTSANSGIVGFDSGLRPTRTPAC